MDENLRKKINDEIKNNEVCLFMKGTPSTPQCGFSLAVSNVLKHLGINFKGINVLEDNNLREAIKEFSDWPTIPQLYIKEEFIGGCDIIKEMFEKGDLEKVYQEQNGELVAISPIPSGYRLPTESEWEWAARAQQKGGVQRYGWGNTFPPTQVTGNYADQSASKTLNTVIDGYNDGFAATAPTGSFRANHFGIFDLGGNVAEWSHDYYSVYPSLSDEIFIDPTGPTFGGNHVIRGASWMRGDIGNTRLSYRDRNNKKRVDVGFRIAKYID